MSVSVLTPDGWEAMGVPKWKRPDDWLPLSVSPGEQKIQLLVAIAANGPEASRVMTVWCRPGFRVDWGDGSAPETVADNVIGKHLYDPDVLPATSEGWKQAVVTITPTGANLYFLNLSGAYYTGKTWSTPTVDLMIGPELSTLTMLSSPQLRRAVFLTPLNGSSFTFSGCGSLRQMQGKVRVTGASVANMFSGNYLQEEFPEIELAGTCTNFSSMFNACSVMKVPPYVDITNGTVFTSMFAGCSSMTTSPDWLEFTTKATNLASLFTNCYRLEKVPKLSTGAATTISGIFQNCANLSEVPAMDTAKVTIISNSFSGCSSLLAIQGSLDFGAVTTTTTAFSGCNALRRLVFSKGPPVSFTVVGMIDQPTLDAIYTALPTITAQTITVTGLPGTLTDTPSIATAKGWTVTGS